MPIAAISPRAACSKRALARKRRAQHHVDCAGLCRLTVTPCTLLPSFSSYVSSCGLDIAHGTERCPVTINPCVVCARACMAHAHVCMTCACTGIQRSSVLHVAAVRAAQLRIRRRAVACRRSHPGASDRARMQVTCEQVCARADTCSCVDMYIDMH